MYAVDIEDGTKGSPLTQGRELKYHERGAALQQEKSPLTQGRELKSLSVLVVFRQIHVAPHTGA